MVKLYVNVNIVQKSCSERMIEMGKGFIMEFYISRMVRKVDS